MHNKPGIIHTAIVSVSNDTLLQFQCHQFQYFPLLQCGQGSMHIPVRAGLKIHNKCQVRTM